MASYKYILDVDTYGQDVWPEKGKIELSKDTPEKDLIYLHQIGYPAVKRVEIGCEKPKKKAKKKDS